MACNIVITRWWSSATEIMEMLDICFCRRHPFKYKLRPALRCQKRHNAYHSEQRASLYCKLPNVKPLRTQYSFILCSSYTSRHYAVRSARAFRSKPHVFSYPLVISWCSCCIPRCHINIYYFSINCFPLPTSLDFYIIALAQAFNPCVQCTPCYFLVTVSKLG